MKSGIIFTVIYLSLFLCPAFAADQPSILGVTLGMPYPDAVEKIQSHMKNCEIEIVSDLLDRYDKDSNCTIGVSLEKETEFDYNTVKLLVDLHDSSTVIGVQREIELSNVDVLEDTVFSQLVEHYGVQDIHTSSELFSMFIWKVDQEEGNTSDSTWAIADSKSQKSSDEIIIDAVSKYMDIYGKYTDLKMHRVYFNEYKEIDGVIDSFFAVEVKFPAYKSGGCIRFAMFDTKKVLQSFNYIKKTRERKKQNYKIDF